MKKVKPLERTAQNVSKGCLNCGQLQIRASMHLKLYQEFGGHHVTRNGRLFYMPEQSTVQKEVPWNKRKTLMYVENRARKHPKSDFRLFVDMPLYGAVYQRQGKNNWVLIKKTNGFA